MLKKRKFISGMIVFLIFLFLIIIFLHGQIVSAVTSVWDIFRGSEGTITVDFNTTIGEMKPVNGINNGPKSGYNEDQSGSWDLDVTELYTQMQIPVVRIHDAEYPYGQDKFIDIHCIFPDFSKDVDDPSSYQFEYTDQYIAAIIESGAEVLFRLGESIDHSGNALYINPPSDYLKWAQICEHIIRHYNHGWADGFEYNIKYWEIWNEPEHAGMWTGTQEEYAELYKVTARYLKEIYPDIFVGGYAASSCSEETITEFLQYIKADGESTPLDFFSWHTYTTTPSVFMNNAYQVRKILDENGYENTISLLDEWNYVKSWDDLEGAKEFIPSADGAAYIASSLIMMQYSPIDGAAYYDGQFVGGELEMIWCGLYDENVQKLPGYYAFYFFGQLYEQQNQCDISGEIEDLYYCATSGEDSNRLLLSNFNPSEEREITFRLKFNGGKNHVTITRINEEHPDGISVSQNCFFNQLGLTISPGEIIYIEFQ